MDHEINNISSSFNGATPNTQHRRRASFDGSIPFSSPISSSSSSHRRSASSGWFKSKTNDFPEIKGRCRNFISRMGRHRRHSSADFSYDPISYALNFDDDAPYSSSDAAIMNFTARLPLSPPARKTTPLVHHLPRSPIPISQPDAYDVASPKIGAANGDLRRGFEALSVSVNEMKVVAGQRRNNKTDHEMSPAAEVKRSLDPNDEEAASMASPMVASSSSSSNQGILVQLC